MDETTECMLALDLGGTWIKGISTANQNDTSDASAHTHRWRSLLHLDPGGFAELLHACCMELARGRIVKHLGIATAGEIDASYRFYKTTARHLGVLATNEWQTILEDRLGCPVSLINDAEAFVLGLAESGSLDDTGCIGAVVVGTGLGFAVVRDGKWWKPGRRLNFLGAIVTENGTYDSWVSASRAADATGNLEELFLDPAHRIRRDAYLDALAGAIATSASLYHVETLFLGGGLAEAVHRAGFDLAASLRQRIRGHLPRGIDPPDLFCVPDANRLTLVGAAAFATGNTIAERVRFRGSFSELQTEHRAKTSNLHSLPSATIVRILWEEEQAAGERLKESLGLLGEAASRIAEACASGGRVIYVGAGTSGRLAAMDAVEMPCTYGTPGRQFTAIIAGGSADAAISIESDFEEDQSAIPEMLLLQPTDRDVVVGISASGTAYFVRSAMEFARSRKAFTILLHEGGCERTFFDLAIRLYSGPEVVSGSTRMKAGTATKKALNFMSTAAMVLLGKVHEGFMVDFNPCNEKLVARAIRILGEIAGLPPIEARNLLASYNHNLRAAINQIQDSTTRQ